MMLPRCLSKVGRRSEGARYHVSRSNLYRSPLDDYERAVAVLPNLRNKEPEAICVDRVTEVALRMLAPIDGGAEVDDLKKVGSVEFFFDHNEKYSHRSTVCGVSRVLPTGHACSSCVRDVKALKEKLPALQAADYLAWMTNRHLRDRDVRCGVFRVLSAPMVGCDYTYDRLVQDYKDWNGYFESGKRRVDGCAENRCWSSVESGRPGVRHEKDHLAVPGQCKFVPTRASLAIVIIREQHLRVVQSIGSP